MAIDPTNPNTLYIGESDDLDGYSALLQSRDGGANWIAIWDWFGDLHGSVKTLAIDPAHPSTLYAGNDDPSAASSLVQPESGGLFKSTDGGTTCRNTGLTRNAVNLLAIDPSNSLILYAGTAGPRRVSLTDPPGPRNVLDVFVMTKKGTQWKIASRHGALVSPPTQPAPK